VGEKSPRIEVHARCGTPSPSAASWRRTGCVMLFVSADLSICKKLIPIAKDFARARSWTCWFVGDSDWRSSAIDRAIRFGRATFRERPEVGMTYRVDKLPYGRAASMRRLIASKGLGEQP